MSLLERWLADGSMASREHFRSDPAAWSASSRGGVVATAHYLASAAGAEMLRRGGNAVDAASLSPTVCEPTGSGLSGMAMMLVHLAESGRTFTVDGPCRAPRSATPEQLAASRRYRGYGAIAVPAFPAVIDGDGNTVAMTQSLERCFGSARLTPELGFLYNGYLRTFKVQNRRHPHFLRPGAPARSNAAPTMVVGTGGRPVALGSTGSERLASSIFEVLVRLRAGQDPFVAVAAPRLHCSPEGHVLLEADRFGADVVDAFRDSECGITRLDAYSFKVGGVQLAVRRAGVATAVADPRRDGAACTGRA